MSKVSPALFQKEDLELDNGILDNISSREVADSSPNSCPPEHASLLWGKKPLKSKVHGSDMGSSILKDGLPGYDNWPNWTNTDLENAPSSLTRTTYPEIESGRQRLSADWLQILQAGNKRYALRDTDRHTFRGSGWVDKDKSGDFNPDEKPERLTKLQRSKVRKTAKIGEKGVVSKASPDTQYPFCIKCRKNKVRNSTGSTSQSELCRKCLISKSSATPESSPASDTPAKKPRALPKKRAATTRAKPFTNNKSPIGQGEGNKKQKKAEKPRTKNRDFNSDFDNEPARPKFSASVSGGKVMYITTSFCHPIQFNWIPPPPLPQLPFSIPKSPSKIQDSSFPCHFCTNPGLSYAIGGLGNKVVEVIQWAHDHTLGYEELEGGWGAAGQEQTRMCQECTTERMLICFCTDHMIRPINGLDPRVFDFESAFQGLLNQLLNRRISEDGKNKDSAADVMNVKWCSVCPQPAFFECCVRPPFTKSGIETSPSDDIGCGLLLCEVCAFRMKGQRQHSRVPPPRLTPADNVDSALTTTSDEPVKAIMTLDEHINAASKDIFHYTDGIRADACFLKADSELMRRQGASSEDAAGEVGNNEEVLLDDDSAYDEAHDRAFKKCKWGMGSPIDLTK